MSIRPLSKKVEKRFDVQNRRKTNSRSREKCSENFLREATIPVFCPKIARIIVNQGTLQGI